jgi:hypothetical protein
LIRLAAQSCSITTRGVRSLFLSRLRATLTFDKSRSRQSLFSTNRTLEDIYRSQPLRREVPRLLTAFAGAARLEFDVTFSTPPADWQPLLRWIGTLNPTREGLDFVVRLTGPFPSLDDRLCQWMMALGLRLRFAPQDAGTTGGQNDWSALRELAMFGFEIPYVGHVHANNLDAIAEEIVPALAANQYSGFSLPLVCARPGYRFDSENPALPTAEKYLGLIETAFDAHPHYDHHLEPVEELALAIRLGGWNRLDNIPARVNLLASAEGVSTFRLVPGMARHWRSWELLESTASEAIGTELFESYRVAYSLVSNSVCTACRWRRVCGGADAGPENPSGFALPEVVCRSRLHMVERLLRDLFA